ncbi:MAG: glycosyltransferase family 2 protein [Pseudobdellovibrio sp.]
MQKPDISFFFPVYNDERTVRIVVEKAIKLFDEIANKYEIIIVNDASPDRAGEIADQLALQYSLIKVIHHEVNKGYGAAVKSGIANSNYEWVCMVDGDDEYDISDLKRMLALRDYYKLIIGFRYKKMYSTKRIFISHVYNFVLRILFNTRFRDISTGIRVFHRSILEQIVLNSNSPFIGAEMAIKAMLSGTPVGEVGIQTFPRVFGEGSATSMKNILRSIRDMIRMRREVFSETYHLPDGRGRN